MFKSRIRIRIMSLLTVLFFIGSTFGAYAQQAPVTAPVIPQTINIQSIPEVQALTSNVTNIENALRQIEEVARPIYNQVAPSNMEAMTVAERVKAIVGNTKTMVSNGVQSYQTQVANYDASKGITPDTSFSQELGVGLNELGIKSSELSSISKTGGSNNALVEKLKTIINAIKDKLSAIINVIRAKVTAIAQKIGFGKKKTDDAAEQPSKDKTENEISAQAAEPAKQYADTFAGKVSKGVDEGVKNAKGSLKSSFSFTNLAVTTTVAVGTNLAIRMIKGERPVQALGNAAKAVATVEFAGSVAGAALGAAGGQFAASMVRAFLPGPIGALVGSFVPVLTGSLGAQMGSSLAGDAKNGQFSITNAWRKVDKVDLVGSAIGSTIGMALGAPIPIIGPIIGGIVGGFLGSKVAKLVANFAKGKLSFGGLFQPKQTIPAANSGPGRTGEISIGGQANTNLPGVPHGVYGTNNEISASSVSASPEIQAAEQQYYQTYLQYNKLVEAGKYDEAKKVYSDLKVYSDQYNALKGQVKTESK